MALALAGKVGASPTPSRNRAPKNALRLGVQPRQRRRRSTDNRADAPYATDAELVEDHADGQLAKGVGPVVGAGEIAEGNVGEAEVGDEGIVRDR